MGPILFAMRATSIAWGLLVLTAALAPAGWSAPSPEECAARKLTVAGKKATRLLKCQSRALTHHSAVDPDCIARVVSKFAATWTRIEGRGGCATVGDLDAIESQVDAYVASLVASLTPMATTTTTTVASSSTTGTPTSTCPPTTALYCGISGCAGPGFPALCPAGMACTSPEDGCRCEGPPVECGSLRGAFCRWGTCPEGQTCQTDPGSDTCPPACACR